MKFFVGVPLAVSLLSVSAIAAPSIDFVNIDGALTRQPTYQSVQCVATDSAGQSFRAQGQQENRASTVPLSALLLGNEGNYYVECTAVQFGGAAYTAVFEAVKFRADTPRSRGPEYDRYGFAYGVDIHASSRLDACYDNIAGHMDEACLARYYGDKPHYLSAVAGARDIEFRGKWFASNVGVFLEENPRYREPS